MKKTFLAPALCAALLAGVLTGCGSTANTGSDTTAAAQEQSKDTTDYSKVASSADMSSVQAVGEDGMEAVSGKQVKDGTYSVSGDCSSKMFHVTDCQLTVKDGEMTAVMTMSGTGYRCIYLGTGEQASKAKPEDYIFPDTNKEGKDMATGIYKNWQVQETVNGYLEAILFAECDEKERYLDERFTISSFSHDARSKAVLDCVKFLTKAWEADILIDDFQEAGANLYFARQGHGAGFFDNPATWGGKECADRLQEIAKGFSGIYIVESNGILYIE